MGLFNFNFNKKAPIVKQVEENFENVFNLSMQTSLPIIREKGGQKWISYVTDEGEDYTTFLEKLYNNSPTHQAIVDTKSLIINGDGFTYNEVEPNQMIELERLLNYIDGQNTLWDMTAKLVKDNQLYGAMCLEVIWSGDFTKINKVSRISPKNIRSGRFEGGKVETYYYSRNFNDRREEVIEIASFDILNKRDHRQLWYIPNQLISNEYYGEPFYIAGCNWISLEAQTGLFYKSLMENGFNPSLIIKYYKKNATIEEKTEIVRGLKKSFGGVKNTGKVMTIFASEKETAPDIEPINVSQLDKQFTVIADQIVTKILSCHRVTTPEMFGIAIAGKLGTADFQTQVKAFTEFVINPEQKKLEIILNKIFKINGLNIDLKIKKLEI